MKTLIKTIICQSLRFDWIINVSQSGRIEFLVCSTKELDLDFQLSMFGCPLNFTSDIEFY